MLGTVNDVVEIKEVDNKQVASVNQKFLISIIQELANIEDRNINFINIKIEDKNPFEEWKNKKDKILY